MVSPPILAPVPARRQGLPARFPSRLVPEPAGALRPAGPLIGPQGLVGAMSITAPAFRITDARVAELGLLISSHCAEISAQLERAAPWRAEA